MSEFFPAKSGETIKVENAWPQPPVRMLGSAKVNDVERDNALEDEPDMSVISTWTALSRSMMEALSAASDTALFSMVGGKWLLLLADRCTVFSCARNESDLTALIITKRVGGLCHLVWKRPACRCRLQVPCVSDKRCGRWRRLSATYHGVSEQAHQVHRILPAASGGSTLPRP